MKLGEIILTEAPLASYGRNYAGPRLGPNNIGFPNGDTVKQLKAALARHQIYIPGQPPNPSQVAWIGDNSGEWTPALSAAIIAWKRSINAQDEKAQLDDSTPELSPRAIDYLLDKELYTTQTNKGLLVLDGGAVSSGRTAPWSGTTVDLGYVINTPTENIKTVRDFLAAIGFSGWSMILSELANKKDYPTNSKLQQLQRDMKELYVQQNNTPVLWLQSWEDNVLREDGEDLKATFANGEEMPFHPMKSPSFDTTWRSIEKGSQRLYDYFKVLGNGLLRKAQQEYEQDQAQKNNTSGEDEQTPEMDPQAVTVWARKMDEALSFDFVALLPGGRPPDDDVKSIGELMSQLRRADDWDKVAAEFNQKFADAPETLGSRLHSELNEDDYQTYVVRNLARIGRIDPNTLFSAIKFGNTQDSIQVEYQEQTYTVMKAKQAGKIVVKQGNKVVDDVLIIDGVLRVAITQSGGSVPDMNVEITDESLQEAGNLVVITVQNTAAFMTPYYTAQNPFDQAVAPNMGPMRLVGLQEQAAKLLQNGLADTAVIDWIAGEVKADAEWLQGTETVHFDRRWLDSENSELLSQIGGILEPQDVTDEEKDLIDRLHREETRKEAVAEIISSNDAEGLYERIYRAYITEKNGQSFDMRASNKDQVLAFIKDATPIPDESFAAIVSRLGIAKAAPVLVARLFKDSMKGEWWEVFGGTQEELAQALIDVVKDRNDYLLVNEYYKQPPVNGSDDLIDDMAAEQWLGLFDGEYYRQLARAIGEPVVNEIARDNLDPQLLRIISDLQSEPTLDNLKRITSALRAPRHNYFTLKDDDGKPTDRINMSAMTAFYNLLDNVRQAETNFSDEEKEEFMRILDYMNEEAERLMTPHPRNVPLNQWNRMYETAKTQWFEE